ncbi:MAG: NlpC/P60 family protein, partial [Chitinophagaceae bacterium]
MNSKENNQKIQDSTFFQKWGIVLLSTINIRKEPNQKSELISQSTMGMPVKILNKKNKWVSIQTIDGYIGWTNYYAIKVLDSNEKIVNFWTKIPYYLFTDYFGIVHSLPSVDSDVVSDIIFNNLVGVVDTVSTFYQILLPNGKVGYVAKQQLTNWKEWLNTRNYNPQDLLKTAQHFLGFPYSWGGTSIKGLDCSGFMQLVFFQQGILLPRDARLQIGVGKNIDTTKNFKHLIVGDLLFFGTKDNITHVAMYVGEQKYIHCSENVTINSFDSTSVGYNKKLKNMLVKVKR